MPIRALVARLFSVMKPIRLGEVVRRDISHIPQ